MSKIKIITHNGHFHADDVFAVVLLTMVIIEPYEIIRTRDEEIIKTGDYVVDVGGIYDEEKNLFDHHQEGGAGKRENGIPYSSLGLVWKKFGEKISDSKEVAEIIENKLVVPIDALDNGVEIFEKKFDHVDPYNIGDIIESFSLSWEEGGQRTYTEGFMEAVEIAKSIFKRELVRAKSKANARAIVEKTYLESPDKKIVVLDRHYPWKNTILKYKELLYVIYPAEAGDGRWHIRAVPLSEKSFENKKSFPEEWRGKRDHELSLLSGVPDAVFCHNGGFIAVTSSKEGAMAMAKKALEA